MKFWLQSYGLDRHTNVDGFEKKQNTMSQDNGWIVTVRPGGRTVPKTAVRWTVRRRYGSGGFLITLDGTGRWTGRPSDGGRLDGTRHNEWIICTYKQWFITGCNGRSKVKSIAGGTQGQDALTKRVGISTIYAEFPWGESAAAADSFRVKTYNQNHLSVLRLPVDGTAVLAAVRRRDGMLGRPAAQGRDGRTTTVLNGTHQEILRESSAKKMMEEYPEVESSAGLRVYFPFFGSSHRQKLRILLYDLYAIEYLMPAQTTPTKKLKRLLHTSARGGHKTTGDDAASRTPRRRGGVNLEDHTVEAEECSGGSQHRQENADGGVASCGKARAGGGPIGRTNRAALARHEFSGLRRREPSPYTETAAGRDECHRGQVVDERFITSYELRRRAGAWHAIGETASSPGETQTSPTRARAPSFFLPRHAAHAALVRLDSPPPSLPLLPCRAVHPYHRLDTESAVRRVLLAAASTSTLAATRRAYGDTATRALPHARASPGTRTAPAPHLDHGDIAELSLPLSQGGGGGMTVRCGTTWCERQCRVARECSRAVLAQVVAEGRRRDEEADEMGSGRLVPGETQDAEPHLPQAVQSGMSGRARRITRLKTPAHPRARVQHLPQPSSKREGMRINGVRAQQGPPPTEAEGRGAAGRHRLSDADIAGTVVITKNAAAQQRPPRLSDVGLGWHRRIFEPAVGRNQAGWSIHGPDVVHEGCAAASAGTRSLQNVRADEMMSGAAAKSSSRAVFRGQASEDDAGYRFALVTSRCKSRNRRQPDATHGRVDGTVVCKGTRGAQ
ncbi:hypothetical protein K438DRAFT_2110114 [Mycena galopus ATCC 62051]|nr:hypothetical protein K438DRAFT_2110114 [Mycena galopus ATCC 62051]